VKRVSVLYTDNPWRYGSRAGGSWTSGAAAQYAGTLRTDELCRIPVSSVLAPSAVLFSWTTNPMLPQALRVMETWGFRYVGKVTWIKVYPGRRRGMGWWGRVETEDLLFGVRGTVKPFGLQEPNYFRAPIGEHSAKPPQARAYIERAIAGSGMRVPHKLELFGRARVDGWTVIGNEIDGQDIRAALRDLAVALDRPADRREA